MKMSLLLAVEHVEVLIHNANRRASYLTTKIISERRSPDEGSFFLPREICNLYYGEMVSSYVRAVLVTGMKKRITARTISLTL